MGADSDLGVSVMHEVLRATSSLEARLARIEAALATVCDQLKKPQVVKEWYTTNEVAELFGKSHFTVREKWCNLGRIRAEKNPETGKWRIPGHEVERLMNGGTLLLPKS